MQYLHSSTFQDWPPLFLEEEINRIDLEMESINLNDSILKANLNSRQGIIWRQLWVKEK